MLTWHYVDSATFDAGEADADGLYFLSDTKEIYRGSNLFSGSFVMVDDGSSNFDSALALITRPAHGKIYLSKTTLAGKIYDGAAWKQIIYPVDTTVTSSGTNPVTGKAVYDYVAAEVAKITAGDGFVKNISYNKSTHTFTVTGGEGNPTIELEGVGVEIAYDKETGALTLKDMKGAVLGSTVNLDLERFVSATAYDSNSNEIILAFTDVTSIDTGNSYEYPGTMPEGTEGKACRAGDTWYIYQTNAWVEMEDAPLTIDVGDLVDTYTAGNTQTISMSVIGNQFTANVILDQTTGGNLIQQNANGLYVAPIDLSEYMALVDSAVENNIATFNADGQVKDSGIKAGGATLVNNDATTLATEAAVHTAIEALRTALLENINGKISKMEGATAGNVVTATADGQVQDSGKTIGGATLTTKDANTLATEAAVDAAIQEAKADCLVDSDKDTVLTDAATDDKIPTSKAVVDALKWVTTM